MASMRSFILLSDLPLALTNLEVACARCDRRGRFNIEDLIVQYGPQKPVAEVLAELATACPQRDAPTLAQQCDPRSPTLAAMPAGQRPPASVWRASTR